MIQNLSSPHNPQVRLFSSLTHSGGIKEAGQFLLIGERLVGEFLQKPNLEITAEILTGDLRPKSHCQRIYCLPSNLFNKIDDLGTHHNILVLKTPKIEFLDLSLPARGLEVISPLGDPGNLGSLIRSAEALGARAVLLTQEAANPFLPRAVKASAGSVLRLPLFKVASIGQLPRDIWALEQGGEDISKVKWPKDLRLLVGEEGPGLPDIEFTRKLGIPQVGQTESLNAVVAASLALFSYSLAHHFEKET